MLLHGSLHRVRRWNMSPGNGGTASMEKVSNVAISEKEHDKILAFCQEKVLFWGNDHE